MVTVIYSWSLSNYLREGKDEGFDWFGLNRFGGGPEGGPGGPIDARGRFFGAWLLGIAGRTDFFGMRIWGFGFGLMLLEFAISFASRFRFTSFFFGIKISSYSESSSSETHPETRLVSFVIHRFVLDRKIWFQRFEVLDASDSTLRWFLIKVRIGQPCWIHKRIGINRLLFRPARSAKRSWADRICNNSWFTNYWFWKF